MTHDGRRRAILAIDTSTSQVVIATGTPDGVADGLSTWTAGYRHGETLLPSLGRFLGERNIRKSRLVGIVVGTGPGAFTGGRNRPPDLDIEPDPRPVRSRSARRPTPGCSRSWA